MKGRGGKKFHNARHCQTYEEDEEEQQRDHFPLQQTHSRGCGCCCCCCERMPRDVWHFLYYRNDSPYSTGAGAGRRADFRHGGFPKFPVGSGVALEATKTGATQKTVQVSKTVSCGKVATPRIVGGDITVYGNHPWQVGHVYASPTYDRHQGNIDIPNHLPLFPFCAETSQLCVIITNI